MRSAQTEHCFDAGIFSAFQTSRVRGQVFRIRNTSGKKKPLRFTSSPASTFIYLSIALSLCLSPNVLGLLLLPVGLQ
jgi:hypothetical protein